MDVEATTSKKVADKAAAKDGGRRVGAWACPVQFSADNAFSHDRRRLAGAQ